MTATIDAFTNLGEVVRRFLEASDNPDPAVIADAIAANMPSEHLREALAEALRSFVRIQAGTIRSAAQRSATPGGAINASGLTLRPSSPVWDEASSAYGKLLRNRFEVGGRGWQFLATMTKDDVLTVARQRITNGEASIAAGRRLERLAQLMSSTQVVADLPESLLLEVFA